MSRNSWQISKIWPTFQTKAISNLTNSSDAMILVCKWEITFSFYFCVKGEGKAGRAEFSLLFWKGSVAHWSNANKDKTLHLCFGFLISFAIWCEVFWSWHTSFSPVSGTEIMSRPHAAGEGRSSVCGVHRPEVDGSLCNSHRRHTGEGFSSEWEMEKLPCNL